MKSITSYPDRCTTRCRPAAFLDLTLRAVRTALPLLLPPRHGAPQLKHHAFRAVRAVIEGCERHPLSHEGPLRPSHSQGAVSGRSRHSACHACLSAPRDRCHRHLPTMLPTPRGFDDITPRSSNRFLLHAASGLCYLPPALRALVGEEGLRRVCFPCSPDSGKRS